MFAEGKLLLVIKLALVKIDSCYNLLNTRLHVYNEKEGGNKQNTSLKTCAKSIQSSHYLLLFSTIKLNEHAQNTHTSTIHVIKEVYLAV